MIRSVWDHILFQARLRPSALAVFDPEGPIPFHGLARDVAALATELLERGLTRRDMVGLDLGFSYLHLLLILALDRLGIPSTSLASSDAQPLPSVIRQRFGVSTIISGSAASPEDSADPSCRWIELADRQRPKFGPVDEGRLGRIDSPDDGLVRVIWSSGTTGGLKGVPIGRTVQAHRLSARRLVRHLGPRTRYFTGVPFASSPGYIMALATLSAGGAVILPHPAMDFISQANALGVTATSGSPSMLADLIGGAAARGRLETMELFMVSGEQLTSRLAREARAALTSNIGIGYGTTENDGVAMADTAIALADPSAVGYRFPWVDCQIVGPQGEPLPAGREGLLRIRSAQTIAGYHGDPAATQRNFRDGWFYPGDVGALTEQGLLRITGRIEDVIVRGGVSLSPLPIEEVIRGAPGVRDVAVFALTGADGAPAICAALVLEPGTVPQAIHAFAAARLGDRAPARLFTIDQLPRNPNGKILRRVLVEWAQRTLAS